MHFAEQNLQHDLYKNNNDNNNRYMHRMCAFARNKHAVKEKCAAMWKMVGDRKK